MLFIVTSFVYMKVLPYNFFFLSGKLCFEVLLALFQFCFEIWSNIVQAFLNTTLHPLIYNNFILIL